MPVDPQLQNLLEMMQKFGVPSLGSISAAEMRARPKVPLVIEHHVAAVHDVEIPGPGGRVPLRIYRPADATDGLIVYFHGGGWVVGDLDSVDATLRAIVVATNCTAVSVDYRLAPEHPFPAAAEDAFAAVAWAASNSFELTNNANVPLILMGDSAGGNLAAATAQYMRDFGGPPVALQVLIYPSTEGDAVARGEAAFEPPFLKQSELGWCFDQYIAPALRQDIRFAPGKAENFAGLPAAVIVTAAYDLLTADGEAYGEKLRNADCEVTHLHYEGAIHGFFTMGASFDIGRRAIGDVAKAIVQRLEICREAS